MGAVSSQNGKSKANVQDESDLRYKTKIGKQSRILVSINSDNTVRISEGISIATQTPRDKNGLIDTITETKKDHVPGMKESRQDKFVQTDNEMEDLLKKKLNANNEQVIIPQTNLKAGKHESDHDLIKEELQVKENEFVSREEVTESENEADVTDFWTDTGVQTDDELTNYGLRIAWDSKSVDASEAMSQHFKEATIKEVIEVEKKSETASPVSGYRNESMEQNIGVTKSPEDNQTMKNVDSHSAASVDSLLAESKDVNYTTNENMEMSKHCELNTPTMNNQTFKSENKNEEEETNRVPEHNVPRLIRPFDLLSLERYGKYKVRLSSDKEKCIVSSAAFLETGDAVLIDRSNQKVKFVDKTFKFISSCKALGNMCQRSRYLCNDGKYNNSASHS